MIPKIRKAFNEGFRQEYYENLQREMTETFGEPCAFRISETPVFLPGELGDEVFSACAAIIDQLEKIDFRAIRDKFIPSHLQSPVPLGNTHFLAIDFGLCDDGKGGVTPQLIELQAFPSLFFYQPFLGKTYKKYYPAIPQKGFHYFFGGLNEASYLTEVRKVILGNENAENVILMELFPEEQKTRIDFWATQKALGIPVVCMTKIIKEGRSLFYEKEGRKIPIRRIYNRVIFDEMQRIKDLKTNFHLNDDLDMEWVTHPDWFFMVSKCIMPLLDHPNVPRSYYLNDYPAGLDLGKYVLKPLFSFAGQGIDLNPTAETIAKIEDKQNYILQQKVDYAWLVKTPSKKNSKVELRILYVWNEAENRLKPVINLTRMSKGELINVSYQTEDTWIGSSISFFED